jgi:uncharacterized protein YbjT (DUF2867 family)
VTDKKIIAVVGATGSQGGGLVRAILDDWNGPFAVRALTRNPDSATAKEFAARGAETVRMDLDDEASLRAAFDGAYGAFVVTNFWERLTPGQNAVRSRTSTPRTRRTPASPPWACPRPSWRPRSSMRCSSPPDWAHAADRTAGRR